MMKNTTFLLILIVFFSSCEKVDKLTQFEMEFTESFTIQAGTPLDLPISISTPEMNTNYQAVFEQYDTRADRIEEISLKEIELIITTPENGSFNFLESVDVSISSGGNDPQSIAQKSDIPDDGSNELALETSEINLKEYLSVDQFSLSVSTVCDEILTTDYTIEVHTVFFVDARVLGQ